MTYDVVDSGTDAAAIRPRIGARPNGGCVSWRGSVRYWALGPLAWHVYVHVLDPKTRRFYEFSAGRRTWQVWPPRAVLNPENEWTCPTDDELHSQIAWALKLLRTRLEQRESRGLPQVPLRNSREAQVWAKEHG